MGGQGEWQVWFPKLYPYKDWKNSLSDDGKTIEEQCTKPDYYGYREKFDRRIVMAHRLDALKGTLYRFLGVFEPDKNYREGSHHIFRLDEKSVNLPP